MALDQPVQEKGPRFKWWHILLLVFIALAGYVLGMLLKLLSHPNADLTLTISSFGLMFCCLLGVVKLIFFIAKNSGLNK